MNSKIIPEANFLFEVSWEACNKVGGIYTVLISKAARIIQRYGSNYCLVGPYFPNTATVKSQFQETEPPQPWQGVFAALKQEGIDCHFGKWIIEGEPQIILLDFKGLLPQANDIKTKLWHDYGIDSLIAGWDFTEPVVWSWAAGRLLENFAQLWAEQKIVAQFHEWLAGGALLYLKKQKASVATVFTTHATTLGRTLVNNGTDLYANLFNVDIDKEVYRFGIQAKHQLEKASSQHCDVLTTVSEITGWEVDRFLGRSPDVILPNGLDVAKFPTFEEIALKHRIQRDRIRNFILYYFFPYYSFDIERTLFYFIACRYEFYNKGLNEYIKALGVLNQQLKKEASDRTIVSFFFVPTASSSLRPELVESRENFRDIKDSLEEISEEIREHFLFSLMSQPAAKKGGVFLQDEELLKEVNNKMLKFKRQGTPPLATHIISDPNDIILKSFQENGLQNQEADRVKVVFYPDYLSGSDGLLNLNYYESITGCHLGIFPSLYEPWGYTPLETAALGVTALTTDVSGLGKFMMHIKRSPKYPGLFILHRYGQSEAKVVEELSKILYRFAKFSREERIKNKIKAKQLAASCDWENLIGRYLKAHNLALSNLKK